MMDKKSANGFSTKASEAGVPRKQLPYSVETPYGFHLDLDFLKYVDDIEKGNTIKRVHIQRRVKGPPKFSTLPRNFSLPGHGVRPIPKEKDSTWSGTSTLGPKPKSRVSEVQQILDFRPGDGLTSSQSSRAAPGQGMSYVLAKPRDDVGAVPRDGDGKTVGIQNRPNLLRASSMPITLQQRKGSDSSSPDRTVGTPETGSTENMFRASPDITERRCVPQDRTGLHQQITVALKRVRELEEQVKTIPELKAQICSLREEREKLLLQLQAQAQAQAQAHVSTSPSSLEPESDSKIHTQPQEKAPSEEINVTFVTQPAGGLEPSDSLPAKTAIRKEKQDVTEKNGVLRKEIVISSTTSTAQGEGSGLSEQKSERHAQLSEKSAQQKVPEQNQMLSSEDIPGQELTSNKGTTNEANHFQKGKTLKEEKPMDQDSTEKLQEKLFALEAKLAQASQQLEQTNTTLKEQLDENKMKEERILQLTEGIRVEVCTPEAHDRPRRQSIDMSTETERVDFANQQTETESPGTVDQGTDTDRICIEVQVPQPITISIEQEASTSKAEAHEQVAEIKAEVAAASPPRPRANSMERGTVTERIITQDQMTETPIAQRVNQVTETEGETETDHPQRPRASRVARGTETERVDTVDRVTETEDAQRTDRQTEREIHRQEDNNPARVVEAEIQVGESSGNARVEGESAVVSEKARENDTSDQIQRDSRDTESVDLNAVPEMLVTESNDDKTLVSSIGGQDEGQTSPVITGGENVEVWDKSDTEAKDSEPKATTPTKSEIAESIEKQQNISETVEKTQSPESEEMCTLEKENVVSAAAAVNKESSEVKTVTPVRPQRGRKPSTEQAKPSPPQSQPAPVRPQRGSSESHAKQSEPQTKTKPQPQAQAQAQPQAPAQPEAQSQTQLPRPEVEHPAASPSVEDQSLVKQPPGEPIDKPSQPQSDTQAPSSAEIKTGQKSIQAQSPSTTVRRGSKELKITQKGSSVAQPSGREAGDAKVRAIRRGSSDAQPQPQGSRRGSSETKSTPKEGSETQSLRRGSSEAAKRRGSAEGQASRRDTGEAQAPRRGSGESPTSPAALGQVVTRLTGLLGEQWAQLGSGSGTQQTAVQQESPSTQKQAAGKRAEAGKGAAAKPAGKAVPAAAPAAGKPAGKPGPSKMSTIQSQLVSSLSVLSAFYSPGQKSTPASKQPEQGLKSIMKKNGVADKQGTKGAKKNLKFVGVNGGYETTSSEESSGDEKPKASAEEEDSSEPEVEKEKEAEPQPEQKPEEGAETQEKDAEASAEGGAAVTAEKENERSLLDPDSSQELLEATAEGEKVDRKFIDACMYVKDRMEEVSSPDKEMRQVLVVLYQEWFRVSSQKDSQADTVTLYLRQVALTTPTLLPYVVNLTDGNGNMALHYSVSHSNFPVVRLLLDTGLCETDNVNKAGYTPVMLAALTAAESPDELEVAQQLLKKGDVNARSRQAGQTALMLAVSHGRVAMVKLLLSSGADVNAQDREGSTPLMCASEHGHTHIVRLLLETGRCDLSLKDKNGQTALSVAEGGSHQDILDLLKAGSQPPSAPDLL
ncbi:uncharacterized protein kank4 isoform X2 [Nelusetta ayraudi]|uniref:uncharacterized protein kank4 isoform X2 n=1 Tax=Nelusetta ayraudi TaxID=303726 RepID=UPI003F708D85